MRFSDRRLINQAFISLIPVLLLGLIAVGLSQMQTSVSSVPQILGLEWINNR